VSDDLTTEQRLKNLERMQEMNETIRGDPKQPANFAGDQVGAGRYILGFLLAGPLGLWANYWARYYGWRGTWISIAMMIAGVILLVAVGGSLSGCEEGFQDGPQGFGYYTCE
jgi:hypothetical protein